MSSIHIQSLLAMRKPHAVLDEPCERHCKRDFVLLLVLSAWFKEVVVEDQEHLRPEHLSRGIAHHKLVWVGTGESSGHSWHPIIDIFFLWAVQVQGTLLQDQRKALPGIQFFVAALPHSVGYLPIYNSLHIGKQICLTLAGSHNSLLVVGPPDVDLGQLHELLVASVARVVSFEQVLASLTPPNVLSDPPIGLRVVLRVYEADFIIGSRCVGR